MQCQYLCAIFLYFFFVPVRDVRMSLTGTKRHPMQGQERAHGMDMAVSAKGTQAVLAKNAKIWYNEIGGSIEKMKRERSNE